MSKDWDGNKKSIYVTLGASNHTPIECERLQGFPDGWTKFGVNEKGEVVAMSDTQRYKQMGNAVTTNVIKAVGERL